MINYQNLYNLVLEVDGEFSPKLSEKIELSEFTSKALKKGHCVFENGDEQDLKGVVVGYANDKVKRYSYISLVAVGKKYRKQGVAKRLVKQFVEFVSSIPYIDTIGIHTNNPIALKMYIDLGFIVIEEINRRYYLEYRVR